VLELVVTAGTYRGVEYMGFDGEILGS
jgi:hypothetical protein